MKYWALRPKKEILDAMRIAYLDKKVKTENKTYREAKTEYSTMMSNFWNIIDCYNDTTRDLQQLDIGGSTTKKDSSSSDT